MKGLLLASAQSDNLAIVRRRAQGHRQRFVDIKPRNRQPVTIVQRQSHRHKITWECVACEVPLGTQAPHRSPHPEPRQKMNGKEKVGDGEEEVYAKDSGDYEEYEYEWHEIRHCIARKTCDPRRIEPDWAGLLPLQAR